MIWLKKLFIALDRLTSDGLDYHLMSVILEKSNEYTKEELLNMTYDQLLDIYRNP